MLYGLQIGYRLVFLNSFATKIGRKKILYLTFDDGPIPKLTPWVLEILAAHNAKATFFCVGDNVRKHPDIFCN